MSVSTIVNNPETPFAESMLRTVAPDETAVKSHGRSADPTRAGTAQVRWSGFFRSELVVQRPAIGDDERLDELPGPEPEPVTSGPGDLAPGRLHLGERPAMRPACGPANHHPVTVA